MNQRLGGRNPLQTACLEIITDPTVTARYSDGMTAADILKEIRLKSPDSFSLCSMLDVHDEMTDYYGKPER